MRRQTTLARHGLWMRYIKRPFDMALAITMLLCLWPVMLFTAVLVRWRLGGPVVFSQERLGKAGTRFTLYKFRSMSDAREPNGDLLPDAERLPPFGKLLRSTSLDELPQIFNVLRGEMSFIGPRATLPVYEPYIEECYPLRSQVTPGLTSLPAICGRNDLSLDEKYALDVHYVENAGFLMDAKILLLTVPVILGRQGIEIEDPAKRRGMRKNS
jgi:undecaprenyl phosphate N,N'-diacetylbacillosamine 1-phosphate transferase